MGHIQTEFDSLNFPSEPYVGDAVGDAVGDLLFVLHTTHRTQHNVQWEKAIATCVHTCPNASLHLRPKGAKTVASRFTDLAVSAAGPDRRQKWPIPPYSRPKPS